MSMRYPNGAIIKPGFNPVLIPGAPTIGTVTGGDSQVIVAFTAPTDIGGSAITSYQVVSSPGSIIATGASSPITVTGLTNGTAYTFRVAAVNSYGAGTFSAASASVTPALVQGQQAYTTPGSYTWIAPTGVTSVSIVAVGSGACSGGGSLRYKNNFTVTPGGSYTVEVANNSSRSVGADSWFNSTTTVLARGGNRSTTQYGCGGGCGGAGTSNAGGGGAGGYSGNGGAGGQNNSNGSAGSGGGGGGGAGVGVVGSCCPWWGAGGGGVGILGLGSNGAGGTRSGSTANGGGGGSGGSAGLPSTGIGSSGGNYGGGVGGGSAGIGSATNGIGAVRIIWPGTTRQFPSTNTGDL